MNLHFFDQIGPWLVQGGLSLNIFFDLILSVVLGGAVGMERSSRGRQAGVRTYALVSLASCCLICAISQESSAMSVGDPASRVIQGLLTGLGFLGAGVIMKDGLNIKGLTTAASIWLTAGLGIVSGLGLWALAIFATVCGLSILSWVKWLEDQISKDRYALVVIKLPADSALNEVRVKAILVESGLRAVDMAFRRDAKRRVEFEMTAVFSKLESPRRLAERLISMNGEIEAFEISSSPE